MPCANVFTESDLPAWLSLRNSWHKERVDQADPSYLLALHSVHTSLGNITDRTECFYWEH